MNGTVTQKPARAFTLKVLSGFLLSVFIIQPIIMYYYLISNSFFVLSAWIPIFFLAEIASLLRAKLQDSELYMLLIFQPVSFAYSLFFIQLIKNMYFAYSWPSHEIGIANYIPTWWVPSEASSKAFLLSKFIFIHKEWFVPITLSLTFLFLSIINDLILGYLSYEVFAIEEKMEFPFARAQIAMIDTLAGRSPDYLRIMFTAALAGAVVNFVTKFIPFFVGAFALGGTFLYAAPSHLFDFTSYLDYFLPGAGFVLPMDLLYYIPGLLLSERVAFIQFLASLLLYFVGSHLITRFDLWPPESKWATGWGYWTLQYRSLIYFYVSLVIGLSLSAMLLPMLLNPTPLIRGIKALVKATRTSRGLLNAKTLFLLYISSSLGIVLLAWYLTSFKFPVLVLIILVVFGSFFATYISTASAGLTISGVSIPYLRELAIYYSGYGGKDIWFVPLPVSLSSSIVGAATTGAISSPLGGSAVAQALLQADIVNVKHSEFIRAYIFLVILSLISSFVLTSIFWYISPIPSSAYPYTVTAWPVDAVAWARIQNWIWSGYLFRTSWIGFGFIVGSLLYIVSLFIFKMPYLLVVFITGSLMGIPLSFGQFIGSLIGNRVIKPRIKENWATYSRLIVTGYLLGDALMEASRILLVLIVKSMWLLPF